MRYVLGFLIDHTCSNVLLILKNRPAWQAGRLNGIGGHIEDGESPHDAMRREFYEETGIDHPDWRRTATLEGSDESFHVTVFASLADQEVLDSARDMTDESVVQIPFSSLFEAYTAIPNLRWLIPQAITVLRGLDPVSHFQVIEWR